MFWGDVLSFAPVPPSLTTILCEMVGKLCAGCVLIEHQVLTLANFYLISRRQNAKRVIARLWVLKSIIELKVHQHRRLNSHRISQLTNVQQADIVLATLDTAHITSTDT